MQRPRFVLFGILVFLIAIGAAFLGGTVFAGSSRERQPRIDPEILDFSRRLIALESRRIVPPKRRDNERRAPLVAGTEPAVQAPPIDITLRLQLPGKGGQVERERRIVRSGNRLYLENGPAGGQWLFHRNPVDPNQMAGCRVDHEERVLVDYPFAELFHLGLGDSWRDLLHHGLALPEMGEMEGSAETREAFGLAFRRHVAREGRQDGVEQVWWNERFRIPLEVRGRSAAGPFTVTLVECSRQVDESLLQDLSRRYPDYERVDLADLEDLLEDREALAKARRKSREERQR